MREDACTMSDFLNRAQNRSLMIERGFENPFESQPLSKKSQTSWRDRVVPPRMDRAELVAHWMKVASGEIVLEENLGCHWCAYAEAVKNDPLIAGMYSHVLCNNPDVIASEDYSDRLVEQAHRRCIPRFNFKPRGVHVMAEGYFDWEPDPDCIARMQAKIDEINSWDTHPSEAPARDGEESVENTLSPDPCRAYQSTLFS
ncbi:MAG: hypothetical protein WCR85_00270 [Sphaerochaeta sp.]